MQIGHPKQFLSWHFERQPSSERMEEFWVVCVCVYTLPFDPSMQRQGIVGSSFFPSPPPSHPQISRTFLGETRKKGYLCELDHIKKKLTKPHALEDLGSQTTQHPNKRDKKYLDWYQFVWMKNKVEPIFKSKRIIWSFFGNIELSNNPHRLILTQKIPSISEGKTK